MWVIDVTEPYGPGDRYVREVLKRSGRPVMLGHQQDRRACPSRRSSPSSSSTGSLLDFVEVVPISARDGENVDCSSSLLLAHLPEGERLYPEDFLTDLPERFFVAEMVREQILRLTREEIPYTTGVLIDPSRRTRDSCASRPPCSSSGRARRGSSSARAARC